ncbi:MAG TPA: hypothetical protein VGX48_08340 [Pyrinomonadaceae bacterium]|jgi:drug/metabolite transporter (DMT)-like permease|nr:hypothetical protein [Pyrinomonadaceae bacterium]
MDPQLYNLFGLLLCLVGALILALGLIVPRRRALEVSLPRMASESDEQNVCLPSVRDRLREAGFALVGVIVMTLGFLLQIIGHWPGIDGPCVEWLPPL